MKLFFKITLIIISFQHLVSCNFPSNNTEEYWIYQQDRDILQSPDSSIIAKMIADYSVGQYIKIYDEKLFIPINYSYSASSVNKYHVPVGDLVVTEEINKYNPIIFNNKDNNIDFYPIANTLWCFVPEANPAAITIEKLKKQFKEIKFYDNNSIIADNSIILFQYDELKKGFYIFLSQNKLSPFFNDNYTKTELIYHYIDLLRLAKNLNNKSVKELDWSKIDYVIPKYLPRYLDVEIIDSIRSFVKVESPSIKSEFNFDNMDLKLSITKDPTGNSLITDLKQAKIGVDYDFETKLSEVSRNFLAKYYNIKESSLTILPNVIDFYSFEKSFETITFHQIPQNKYLVAIETDESFYPYYHEIISRYFNKTILKNL